MATIERERRPPGPLLVALAKRVVQLWRRAGVFCREGEPQQKRTLWSLHPPCPVLSENHPPMLRIHFLLAAAAADGNGARQHSISITPSIGSLTELGISCSIDLFRGCRAGELGGAGNGGADHQGLRQGPRRHLQRRPQLPPVPHPPLPCPPLRRAVWACPGTSSAPTTAPTPSPSSASRASSSIPAASSAPTRFPY